VTGLWNAPVKLKAKLTGNGLDAEIDGSAELFKAQRAASVGLNIRRANVAPLVGMTGSAQAPLPLTLTSRVVLAGQKVTFDGLDGTIGSSRVRGRLGFTLGDEIGVDGAVGADVIDVPSALLVAIGAAGHDSGEPLNRGLLGGWRGRIEFSALRGTMPGGEFRPFNGVLRNDGQALVLENLSAGLGGGKLQADVAARRSPEGVALTGRVQLEGVDGATLKHRGLAMPAGRVSARTSVSGQGRSAASLIGSLNGNGSVTIEQARIAGLDPRAFDAATRASDTGIARDDAKLAAAVGPALAAGALTVPSAEIPFAIRDGQVRVSNTTLAGEGARLNLSGGYDIAADQIDVRAALAATVTDAANLGRPEILVLLFGSPDRPARTIDVAALSSWLGLRAIDRETKRLDAIERTNPLLNPQRPPEPAPPPQAAPPAPAPSPVSPRVEAPPAAPPATAPPLPPPVEVRPPPGARPLPRQGAPLNILPSQQRPSTF
jgi:AsmA-like C-terminal region